MGAGRGPDECHYSDIEPKMPNHWAELSKVGWRSLLSLLYPPECVWCGTVTAFDQRLCAGCRALFLSDAYCCRRCAAPLPRVVPNDDCVRCRDARWRFARVIALGPYRADHRAAVIAMKKPRFEPLRRALGELLGERLRDAWPAESSAALDPSGGDQPLLIPVPNHWTHGFAAVANTAQSLAEAIARPTGWSVASGIATRVRKTSKQGMLSWAERQQNVRGAFAIRRPRLVAGRSVIVVDDVLTSGATANELSKLLRRAGAERVWIAVAARGTGGRDATRATS